jgi:hypothetical protein
MIYNIRRPNRHSRLDTNTTPKSWQTYPITEGVREYRRVDIPRPEKDKCREEAEQGGIGELEEGPRHGHYEWRSWVPYAEFVHVVEMRDAEVQGSQEDDLLAGKAR